MTLTTTPKHRGAYWQRLEAFCLQAEHFTEAQVYYSEDGHDYSARSMPSDGAACECCGTLRLKHRFPVLLDGDVTRVRWIGQECMENISAAGKLRATCPSPVINMKERK